MKRPASVTLNVASAEFVRNLPINGQDNFLFGIHVFVPDGFASHARHNCGRWVCRDEKFAGREERQLMQWIGVKRTRGLHFSS
jgi:hypothetical protein